MTDEDPYTYKIVIAGIDVTLKYTPDATRGDSGTCGFTFHTENEELRNAFILLFSNKFNKLSQTEKHNESKVINNTQGVDGDIQLTGITPNGFSTLTNFLEQLHQQYRDESNQSLLITAAKPLVRQRRQGGGGHSNGAGAGR